MSCKHINVRVETEVKDYIRINISDNSISSNPVEYRVRKVYCIECGRTLFRGYESFRTAIDVMNFVKRVVEDKRRTEGIIENVSAR